MFLIICHVEYASFVEAPQDNAGKYRFIIEA